MRFNKILATAAAALLAVGLVNRFLVTSALAQNEQTDGTANVAAGPQYDTNARVCCS
jgi:hypothetical protein